MLSPMQATILQPRSDAVCLAVSAMRGYRTQHSQHRSPISLPAVATSLRLAQPAGSTSQRLHSVVAAAAARDQASHKAYPWHDSDFVKVTFAAPPYGPLKLYEDVKGGTFNGVLVFRREGEVLSGLSSEDENVLEVFVSGDTAFNTWTQLTHRSTDRPMVHDLMWNLLEHAREGAVSSLTLLRVAIVELRDNVFIGRLFFGDAATGQVHWDCDCRPSDGCYLSIRANCPFFVHRRVWEMACQPIRQTSVYRLVAASATMSGSSPSSSAPGAPGGSWLASGEGSGAVAHHQFSSTPPGEISSSAAALSVDDYVQLRPDDMPAITLLKRQLTLAVKEEDYREAARLRDHTWMRLYRDIHVLRVRGAYEEAHRLEAELRRQVESVMQGGGGTGGGSL